MSSFFRGSKNIYNLLLKLRATQNMLLYIWVALVLAVKGVYGSGVGAHLTFLGRTAVPDQLVAFYPYLKAGSFFPDALYSCNTDPEWHKFAESTHWPDFLIQGIRIWQQRYGHNKLSKGSLKLKSFLTGVFTHQVADVSWHSLVSGYESHGLISVLAGLEFKGNVQEAHDYIDTMGDLLMLGHVIRDISDDWSYYADQRWELPDDGDLMDLVHRMGLANIDHWQLTSCVKRGMVAASSEVYSLLRRRKEVLEVAYAISPRAYELMQDHWLGGEFDVVAMINKCLPTFLSLFDNLQDNNSRLLDLLQICGNLPPVKTKSPYVNNLVANKQIGELLFVSPLVPVSNFGTSIAVGMFQGDEICVAVSSPLENGSGSVYVIPWSELSDSGRKYLPASVVTPMYGDRVHTFALFGVDYLVVSEAGSNTIHFYYEGIKLMSITDRSSWERHQLVVSSIQDIDGDGIPDVLLSGPHYGKNETGIVIIINGNDISKHLNETKNIEVELSSLNTISLRCPLSLNYQHFGSEIKSSSEWNRKGFLYVTSQGLGVVFVYCLCNLHQNSLPRYYIIGDSIMLPEEDVPFNFTIKPSIEHGMFGSSIHTWNYEGENYVGISQHLKNTVYIFKETKGFLESYMQLHLDIAEDATEVFPSIGFGTSMDYDHETDNLFISSPGSFNGDGAIWKISMREISRAKKLWKLSELLITIPQHLLITNGQSEKRGIVGFGKVLKVGPRGRLVIGIPYQGYGNLGKKPVNRKCGDPLEN